MSATLGLRYVVDMAPKVVAKPAPEIKEENAPPSPLEPTEQEAKKSPVSGIVTDADGKTLAQVNITLTTVNGTLSATTDDAGRYEFAEVPFGQVVLRAETADFAPGKLKTELSGNGSLVELSPIKLRLATLRAQIQGLVRAFSGSPLQATVLVDPPGVEHECSADGRFAIDVEPGSYTVTISAEGHRSQTRTVSVPKKGVIIFNADLRKRNK